jgi:hypothetical protein
VYDVNLMLFECDCRMLWWRSLYAGEWPMSGEGVVAGAFGDQRCESWHLWERAVWERSFLFELLEILWFWEILCLAVSS